MAPFTHQGIKNKCNNKEKQTHSDLAQFLHGACFSLVKSTFFKAIKNTHFTTWPVLDGRLIQKYLLPSRETEAGHLNQKRQYLHSTSTNKKIQERINKLIQDAPKGQPFKQTL